MTSTDTAVLPRSGEEPSKGRENGEGSQADLETEISIRGLTKSFGSQTVLEDITCDIPKGKITLMLGPSGTGKSVFLKNIMGLLKPECGEIWIDGRDIVKLGSRELYKVRCKFGVLFQDGALFGSMNIYDKTSRSRCASTPASPSARSRTSSTRSSRWSAFRAPRRSLPGEISGGMKTAGRSRASRSCSRRAAGLSAPASRKALGAPSAC